jgi:hypothetical protein
MTTAQDIVHVHVDYREEPMAGGRGVCFVMFLVEDGTDRVLDQSEIARLFSELRLVGVYVEQAPPIDTSLPSGGVVTAIDEHHVTVGEAPVGRVTFAAYYHLA